MITFSRFETAAHIRNYFGLDQTQFAAVLGVAASTVQRWESGVSPTPRWLWLAAKGMTFTHDGKSGCRCRQCARLCPEQNPIPAGQGEGEALAGVG